MARALTCRPDCFHRVHAGGHGGWTTTQLMPYRADYPVRSERAILRIAHPA